MKSYNRIISALLVSGILLSCSESTEEVKIPTKNTAIPVKVVSLKKGDFSSSISATGTFSTKNETILSFKIGGIISELSVEEGQKVSKGQVLGSLDLTEIQTSLNQARLGLEKAERDFARANRLYTDSVATLEQLENATTALEIAKEQYKAVEFNVQFSQIRATQNGFVLKKFTNTGQQVSAGAPVLQINGTASGSWTLKATVNDKNWSRINLGDSVNITTDTNTEVFDGNVIRKSQAADPVTGAFWVEIKPKNSSELNLASGMFARATIYPTKKINGWEVPYASILDADGNRGFVFVTNDDQKAERISVELGEISTNSVQVISGLENQKKLIVSGSAYLTDESPITIQN